MADDFDDEADVAELPRQQTRPPGLAAIAEEVRDTLLPEFNGQRDDVEEYVELTPEGQAVCDGAFTTRELIRIVEATTECQRRCAPAMGVTPAAPLDAAPQALAALHRLKFTIGTMPGGVTDGLFAQAEDGVANLLRTSADLAGQVADRVTYASAVTNKLAQVVAVIEAEKRARAVGGTVVAPDLIDNLAAALAEPIAAPQ